MYLSLFKKNERLDDHLYAAMNDEDNTLTCFHCSMHCSVLLCSCDLFLFFGLGLFFIFVHKGQE